LYIFEEEDPLFCRKLAKNHTKNLLFNTKTRLKRTFCEKLRNNSLFGKKTLFVWEGAYTIGLDSENALIHSCILSTENWPFEQGCHNKNRTEQNRTFKLPLYKP